MAILIYLRVLSAGSRKALVARITDESTFATGNATMYVDMMMCVCIYGSVSLCLCV